MRQCFTSGTSSLFQSLLLAVIYCKDLFIRPQNVHTLRRSRKACDTHYQFGSRCFNSSDRARVGTKHWRQRSTACCLLVVCFSRNYMRSMRILKYAILQILFQFEQLRPYFFIKIKLFWSVFIELCSVFLLIVLSTSSARGYRLQQNRDLSGRSQIAIVLILVTPDRDLKWPCNST